MLQLLHNPPRHFFFTGKGGVGKTSLACATAVHLARQGGRVLLVSTDPASNIAQVLDTTIGHQITPVAAVPGLDALEIDPDAAAEAYRQQLLSPVRSLLPVHEIEAMTEQLSGSCTTEVASFHEFTTLLADPGTTAAYDHVIFDTAPTGHTIRLLQLPGSWSSYLEAGRGDTSCLGPLSGLENNRALYRSSVRVLTDPSSTRLVLVARAQQSTLREVERTLTELADLDIQATHLVVNGLLPAWAVTDELSRAIHEREQAALGSITGPLAALPRDLVPLRDVAMVGLGALSTLLSDDVTPQLEAADEGTMPADPHPSLAALVDELARSDHGLVMTMGKGGVGKTTIAAAVALGLVRRGKTVLLTTTDPAAHLARTLEAEVDGLELSAIDPERAVAEYRDHVMATKGARLDDAGRAALAEDLMSPCTEEVAVFQQFSRAVNRARREFVVMDTAPTGHTLLLMDTTGSYHRDVTRHLDDDQRGRVTTPLMRLQDPDHTKIVVVTLAETTPVTEAQSLVSDLERAGIHPWAWVVNNSLAAARPTSPLLAARARAEEDQLATVARSAARMAVVPTQTSDPVGADRLAALTG